MSASKDRLKFSSIDPDQPGMEARAMKTNRRRCSDWQWHTGLTLIELLVVIAITIAGGDPNVVWLRTSGK